MASSALFQQYENDYCSKATGVSRKLQGVAALPTGVPRCWKTSVGINPVASPAQINDARN